MTTVHLTIELSSSASGPTGSTRKEFECWDLIEIFAGFGTVNSCLLQENFAVRDESRTVQSEVECHFQWKKSIGACLRSDPKISYAKIFSRVPRNFGKKLNTMWDKLNTILDPIFADNLITHTPLSNAADQPQIVSI